MDEKEIKQAEELYEIGENIGFMFGALIRGILDGVEAFEMSVAARDIEEIHETEEGLKRPSVKTEIGDCRRCWCDRCANIEACTSKLDCELPDGIHPFPCLGCENGMRFMPEEEPPCDFFKEADSRNNG
jgi:hypothetical protein